MASPESLGMKYFHSLIWVRAIFISSETRYSEAAAGCHQIEGSMQQCASTPVDLRTSCDPRQARTHPIPTDPSSEGRFIV